MHSATPVRVIRSAEAGSALTSRSDDELMQLCASGVQGAFEVLVRRYQCALRAFCARACGVEHGDDIAQEVLVAVYRARASYVPSGRFRAFLFTVAARRSKNFRRRASRLHALPPTVLEGVALDDSALDAVLARERRERIQGTLDELPDAQRTAVFLRFVAGLEYAEIASVIARPEATARTRVHMALSKLHKLLSKRGVV